MAWDFKPGMKVVCVDVSPMDGRNDPFFETHPVVGEVYTIREVTVRVATLALLLVEITNPTANYRNGYSEVAFRASRFRPVRTTSIESLEAHLNTLPVRTKTEA